jgi:GT2 family glycosyltransferase
MPPKVSIITVSFNGRGFLDSFFNSLAGLDYRNTELIFVDNASSDGSVGYVKQNCPAAIVVENKDNLGFCVANNEAVERASGDYLFFLNNDTKIDRQAINVLVEAMDADKNIGICGCRMNSFDGKKYFHTGIGLDIFGYPVAYGPVFYAEGSAMMMRKEFFQSLGGFDSKYFMFHEDVDIAWRAWLYGYKVVACDKAIVYHMLGASAGGNIKEGKYRSTLSRRYLSERNNIRTLLKNYSTRFLVLFLPFYVMINAAEMFLFLIIGQAKVCACYLRAYLWNIRNIEDTLNERRRIQEQRKVSDASIIRKMAITAGKFFALRRTGVPYFK